MSLKDELEKSIPAMELTEKEKSLIRARIKHKKRRFSLKPAVISIAFFMILSILIWSALPQIVTEESFSKPYMMNGQDPHDISSIAGDEDSEEESLDESPERILNLTDEQKRKYYEEYQKILDEANALKIGKSWGLSPIEEWDDASWVTPEELKRSIQEDIENHLATEREKVAMVSKGLPEAKTVDGVTTKQTYIYFSDILRKMSVSVEFETGYNESLGRHVFASVDNVTTKMLTTFGEWEQTGYEVKLKDGETTYSIRIEGVYNINGISLEKAFTIEFTCDEVGNIY